MFGRQNILIFWSRSRRFIHVTGRFETKAATKVIRRKHVLSSYCNERFEGRSIYWYSKRGLEELCGGGAPPRGSSSKGMSVLEVLRQHGKNMLEAGIQEVLPCVLMPKNVHREGDTLVLRDGQVLPLEHNVYIVGFGKAVGGMARALQGLLGDHLVRGIISVPLGTRQAASQMARPDLVPNEDGPLQVFEGARNNLPDDNSLAAATAIVSLMSRLQETDLLIVLISGGGSALLPLPLEPLTLTEKLETIRLLASGGAKITELNTVRKRLSGVKGGNLLRHTRARVVSLILSDVVEDHLDVIASGPTVPNRDDPGLPLRILDKYALRTKVPQNVLVVLNRTLHHPEPLPNHAFNVLLGNNKVAARATCTMARHLGYHAYLLTVALHGDVRVVGEAFAQLAFLLCGNGDNDDGTHHVPLIPVAQKLQVRYRDLEQLKESCVRNFGEGRPVCVVAAGETTVHVTGPGRGGRTQEMALAVALEFDRLFGAAPPPRAEILFVAAGTDGQDGPTDATGAMAHLATVSRAREQQLHPEEHLERNDSHTFFRALDGGVDHLITGLTGTNVMDIHLLLLRPRA